MKTKRKPKQCRIPHVITHLTPYYGKNADGSPWYCVIGHYGPVRDNPDAAMIGKLLAGTRR